MGTECRPRRRGTGRPAGARPAGALLLAGALVALAGCSGSPPAAVRAAADAPAAASSAVPEGSTAATHDDVELRVTGFHVLPAVAGDPQAEGAARSLGVPVTAVAQLHLMLTVTNTGVQERSVAGDLLRLAVGGRTVEPVPGPLLPLVPLPAGSRQDAAAGFYVAVRAGEGSPALRWTHGDRTAVLPLGSVRRAA